MSCNHTSSKELGSGQISQAEPAAKLDAMLTSIFDKAFKGEL